MKKQLLPFLVLLILTSNKLAAQQCVPSLGTVTQVGSVCNNIATIELTGLLPKSDFSIVYNINNKGPYYAPDTSNSSGNGSFYVPVISTDNGKYVIVTQIINTTFGCYPNYSSYYTYYNTALLSIPTIGTITQVGADCSGNDTIELSGLQSNTKWIVDYTINGGVVQTDSFNTGSSGTGGFTVPLIQANNGQLLIITDMGTEDNCLNTYASHDSVTLSVNSNPTIIATPNTASYCRGGHSILTASGANMYTWSPSIGLSATTGDTVTAEPPTNTTYIVTGISLPGCSATDTVTVTVNPPPALTIYTAPDTLCSGQEALLSVSGATSYSWSPSASLNSSIADSVIASPTSTTTYTVIGTNTYGCSSADSVILIVESCTGVNQLSHNNYQLSIYPNPTSGQFSLQLENPQNAYTIEIYNVIGEKVYQSVSAKSQIMIDLKTQPSGMYFVYLKSEESVKVGKVLVTK